MTLGWELLTVITSLALPLDTAVLQFINIIVEVSILSVGGARRFGVLKTGKQQLMLSLN